MVPIDTNYGTSPSGVYISAFPAHTPVGMAYVPFQQLNTVYELEDAFKQGTLFPELDFPWLGRLAFSKEKNLQNGNMANNQRTNYHSGGSTRMPNGMGMANGGRMTFGGGF